MNALQLIEVLYFNAERLHCQAKEVIILMIRQKSVEIT